VQREGIARITMGKTAIILSGGGITGGIYELGALAALDDLLMKGKRSTDFDMYIGISAGAIPASLLANGISSKIMYRSILGPANNPFFMNQEDLYSFSVKKYMRGMGRYLLSLPQIIRKIRSDKKKIKLVNLLSALESYLPSGIYSNENLLRYMERLLSLPGNTDNYDELRKELYIIAVELDKGERWVFGEEGKRDIPISKTVQASSAIPVFFSPVEIEGSYFIDGAAERSGHVDVAIKNGATLVVIINPVVPVYNDKTIVSIPTVLGCCKSIAEAGISSVNEQSFRINSRVKLDLGISLLREAHPEVDFLLIEPGQMESTLFLYGSMNYSERLQILNYGYNSASIFFIEHFDMLEQCFGKYNFGISLDSLKIDKFLYFTTKIKSKKRFSLAH